MSDEELVALDDGQLSDVALAAREKEHTRRGIEPGSGAAAAAPEEPAAPEVPEGVLIAAGSYGSAIAAESACHLLEQHGITCGVEGEDPVFRVVVPSLDHGRALGLLAQFDELTARVAELWIESALPGRTIVIEDMLVEDEVVAARLTVDGKQQAFCFVRVASGEVFENWHNFDQLR